MNSGRRPALLVALGATLLLLNGCAFGALTVHTNHLRYNKTLRATQNQQFLLNIVRLRYRDPPQFVAVTNITSSHSFDASANVRGELRERVPTLHVLGGAGGIAERPTISYSPMQGAEFTKRLLTPIHLETLVLLSNTGWDIDRVLRVTAQEMNNLENVPHTSGAPEPTPRFEEFTHVARLLRVLQRTGQLELVYDESFQPRSVPVAHKDVRPADLIAAADKRYEFRGAGEDRVVLMGRDRHVVLRPAPAAWQSCELPEAVRLLGLVPGLPGYKVYSGEQGQLKSDQVPRADVVVTLRSVLSALIFASKAVEVPPEHVREGLVSFPAGADGQPFDWAQVTGDLLQVRVAKFKPHDAFVAVKYRGYWYYIDDDDQNSKSTFALLLQVYGLEIAGGIVPGPVLTLPVGGGSSLGGPGG